MWLTDVAGDGFPDLMARDAGIFRLYRGYGTGEFYGDPESSELGINGIAYSSDLNRMWFADIQGDAKQDLQVPDTDGCIYLYSQRVDWSRGGILPGARSYVHGGREQ